MIAGGNWWRANEIVIRHLTWQTSTRYRCRDRARAGALASSKFVKENIVDWMPTEAPTLIFANGALDFLSDHHVLFPRLAATLEPGGVLAVQMTSTARESSHALMRMVAAAGLGRRDWCPSPRPCHAANPTAEDS